MRIIFTSIALLFAATGGAFAHAMLDHAARQRLSTFGRKRGILMRVHSVLRESLTFDDISVHRSDRMDNLLKDHS